MSKTENHVMQKNIRWFSFVRILGMALVLSYHFFKNLLPGGFIGVDVFFTFSGYLITALMIDEFRKKGQFQLGSFYKRRFLRIFPPLFLTVLFCLPLALLISPDFTASIAKQVAASLGFSTNYFEILNGGSYEDRLLPHLFIHTWSLAVEAHFYIIWGLICAFFVIVLGPLSARNPKGVLVGIKFSIFLVSIVLAVMSFSQMKTFYATSPDDPSMAYMNSTSHGFPFLIGAAAGAIFGIHLPKGMRNSLVTSQGNSTLSKSEFTSIIATGVIIFGIAAEIYLARTLTFSGKATYQYGFLVATLLATLIIIAARILHEVTPQTVNEPKILVALSDLSYDMYLFHWPLYIVFSNVFKSNTKAASVTFLLTLALSALSYYLIEPIFHSGKKRQKHSNSIGGRVVSAIAVVIILIITLPVNVKVFMRAPEISTLESELQVGYLHQDADKISAFKNLADIINSKPLTILDSSTGTSTPPILPPIYNFLPGASVFGDSVCLGARASLTKNIPDCDVDSEGSRPLSTGYNLIMQRQEEGTLREIVVVALGTNGDHNYKNSIDKIINDIEPGHRLIFVTPYDGRADATWLSYKTMEYMKTLPAQYPFVTLADWYEIIKPQTNILGPDRIHIGGETKAIGVYTDMIKDAIDASKLKPVKYE
ncbi:acyltransferase [Clostridia bacterium]|nr:acyltransferase [Clostridia bacterium]